MLGSLACTLETRRASYDGCFFFAMRTKFSAEIFGRFESTSFANGVSTYPDGIRLLESMQSHEGSNGNAPFSIAGQAAECDWSLVPLKRPVPAWLLF